MANIGLITSPSLRTEVSTSTRSKSPFENLHTVRGRLYLSQSILNGPSIAGFLMGLLVIGSRAESVVVAVGGAGVMEVGVLERRPAPFLSERDSLLEDSSLACVINLWRGSQ